MISTPRSGTRSRLVHAWPSTSRKNACASCSTLPAIRSAFFSTEPTPYLPIGTLALCRIEVWRDASHWRTMSSRHSGWKAMAEAVTPGARVTRLRRLAGAGMTDAYDVTLDRTPRRVVVKLFRDGDGTAPLEWSRLGFAQRVALPVPEPIVADLKSVWFGRPTVVMSRLPGRPDLTPKDVDSWVGALAHALAELHETPLDGAEGAVTRPPRFETWRAPAGEHDPLTAAAVGAVTARLPSHTSE